MANQKYLHRRQKKTFASKANKKSLHRRQTKNLYIEYMPKILRLKYSFQRFQLHLSDVFHPHQFSKFVVLTKASLLLTRASLFLTDMYTVQLLFIVHCSSTVRVRAMEVSTSQSVVTPYTVLSLLYPPCKFNQVNVLRQTLSLYANE